MYKQNSEFKSIQKKLVGAVAMVLVACIMVVSSSYAWFTLSTAPEVKGIQTSVGSNGNLEIALRMEKALSEIENGEGLTGAAANETWGNLVDLSFNDIYGLDRLSLAPSRLNSKKTVAYREKYTYTDVTVEKELEVGAPYGAKADDGEVITTLGTLTMKDNGGAATNDKAQAKSFTYAKIETERPVYSYSLVTDSGYLRTPQYGTDGRITSITANTVNGIFNPEKNAFNGQQGDDYGVRGVGVTSNISPEQLAMRNAKATVRLAISNSKDAAIASLRNDAVAMANMIIQAKLASNPTYTAEDKAALNAAIGNLEEIVAMLEDALKEAIVAVGLSEGKSFTKDKVSLYNDEKTAAAISVDGVTLTWLTASTSQVADMNAAIAKLITMTNTLSNAKSKVETSPADALSAMLSSSDVVLVNGSTRLEVDEAATNLGTTATLVMDSNTIITIEGGIYATIAEFRGNYSAEKVDVKVDFSGTTYAEQVNQMMGSYVVERQLNIATDAAQPANGYHLEYVRFWMEGLTVSGSSSDVLISDYYGYVLDFAFRTNAKNSSLLLQTAPASRVNGAEGVQGAGSYMKYKAESSEYSTEQMIDLMKAIRVVFTDDTGAIYGVAALDMSAEAVSGVYTSATELEVGDTITTAEDEIYLVSAVSQTVRRTLADGTVDAEAANNTYYTYDSITYQKGQYSLDAEGYITAYLYMYGFTIDTNGIMELSDDKLSTNSITALQQNIAQGVSVLVYLDGDHMDNGDVAISGNSMTGTMNLQFASSADLIPMQYTFNPQTALAAPTNVALSGEGVLSFDAVENATSYEIYVNGTATGKTITGSTNITAALSGADLTGFAGQTVNITLVATADGYQNSQPSDPVNYEVPAQG